MRKSVKDCFVVCCQIFELAGTTGSSKTRGKIKRFRRINPDPASKSISCCFTFQTIRTRYMYRILSALQALVRRLAGHTLRAKNIGVPVERVVSLKTMSSISIIEVFAILVVDPPAILERVLIEGSKRTKFCLINLSNSSIKQQQIQMND